jgi:hypothetical protein
MDVCLLWILCVVQVEVSSTGRSFVQRSSTVCVCVCVCVSLSVIRCNNNPVPLQWVDRRGETKKERKKERKKETFYRVSQVLAPSQIIPMLTSTLV